METNYSSLDTIEKYELVFRELKVNEEEYDTNNVHRKLIDLVGGLGLTNSVHEKFIKCIISEYCRLYSLSNTKRNKLIHKYKAPNKIKDFAQDLQLDLDEAFDLEKASIQGKYAYITNVESILSVVSEQRSIRNDYLHGDFNFVDNIGYELYCQQITQFQEIHNFIFKIFRYSFNKNFDSLPELFA